MQVLDDNIALIGVNDSRLQFKENYAYQVRTGASDHTYRYFSTTSSSNNGLTFNITPPNDLVAMSRQVYIQFKASISVQAVSNAIGQQIIRASYDGLRQFPLSSITDNISLTINGQKMNIQLARQIHPLSKFFNNDIEDANTFLSGEPNAPDQTQNYNDAILSLRNPLNSFFNTPINGYIGRGNGFSVSRNDLSTAIGQTLTAVIDIDVISPIFMNPFQWKHASSSFIHLNTLDVNLTFLSTWPNRIWSHADLNGLPIAINSVTGQISNTCQMLVEFLTPQETALIPKVLKYNYSEINPYLTQHSPVASKAQTVINSQQIQLGVVPKMIYVFVRNNWNSLSQNCQLTDTFFSIENVKIQWNNKDSIFSSASSFQLYQIALEHGYNVSYREHSGAPMVKSFLTSGPAPIAPQVASYPCGSVLAFEFGKDIPCSAMEAAGSVGNYQISMQVTCTNLSDVTVTPELTISTCVDGIFTMAMAYGRIQTALLTPSNVFSTLDSQKSDMLGTNDISGLQGGDFFESLRNTGQDIFKYLEPVNKFLRKHKILSTAGLVANTLGVPIPGLPVMVKALDRLGYGMDQGGVRSGGAKMPRKQLSKMSKRVMY